MSNDNVKKYVQAVAKEAADKCNAEAQKATGWMRWLWALGAIVSAAVACFLTGCESVTPAQIHAAHAVYHLATGKKCVIEHTK